MDEIVKQCILISESYISNDEGSNYAGKDVLLCINSCLWPSLAMVNQQVKQSLPGENKYNKC